MSEKITPEISVALIGASGYTGSELARLLATHPRANLTLATASGERVGQRLSDLFPSLRGVCDLKLQEINLDEIAENCDVAVIALGHGKALELAPQLLNRGVRVIDLGADFRLRDADEYAQWYGLPHSARELLGEVVYGLPEWNRAKIKTARLVANPGCYPTSAILALAPFIEVGAIKAHSIIVNSASGASGAGRASFGVGTHFPEYVGDFKAYNVGGHRHTPEIEQMLNDVSPNSNNAEARAIITFTAHLLPVARGILSTCYAAPMNELTSEEAHQILSARYRNEPFVRVLPLGQYPQIKHVNGSNFCDVGTKVDARTSRLIVISAEDNLLKGASGQALQNLNIMFDLPETMGLQSAPVFP